MAADTPTVEPRSLRAGDTWTWKRSLGDYPASTWTLKYYLLNAAHKITLTATASGDDHLIDVAGGTTAAYAPGAYGVVAKVSDGTDTFTVWTGTLTVEPDHATITTLDGRSHARRVLEALEAALERKATRDQMSYTINGRSLQRMTWAELLAARDRYKVEVEREDAAAKLANGQGSARRILVRL